MDVNEITLFQLELDFVKLFPGKEKILFGEWATFSSCVISLLEKKGSKDPKVKELLSAVNSKASQGELL